MLLGRGGGSNEDLAAFNAEKVAQAIFASAIRSSRPSAMRST